jgi:molecular chaperone GrpE
VADCVSEESKNIVDENAEAVNEQPEAEAETTVDPENVVSEEEVQEESEDAESTDSKEKTESKDKGTFFGKKKKEKEKYEQQIEDLTDRLRRSLAEFDNFRKRTEKEKSSMYVIGAREIVEKILPIVDNFERGLAQAVDGDPFADGMKMIYKQLVTTLDDLGVKPIEAVGMEFDPNFHNAVMHVEDESVGDNIVVEELQKGYTYKDFVVRHSMVKVAN